MATKKKVAKSANLLSGGGGDTKGGSTLDGGGRAGKSTGKPKTKGAGKKK